MPADVLTPPTDEGLRDIEWQLVLAYLKTGILSLGAGLFGSVVGMILLAIYLPKMPMAGRIISANPDHDAIQIDDPYHGAAQMGDIGVAESLLRPSGKARFGSVLVDVVTEGDHVDADSRIEVVERHGNRVVVRCVK